MIHLDASFLIRALVPGSAEDRRLRDWLTRREPVAVSAIAWTEFLCGPLSPEDAAIVARFVEGPVAFESDDCEAAARIFNDTGRRRGSLADCMIAAAAIRADAEIATANPRDFKRFVSSGLKIA